MSSTFPVSDRPSAPHATFCSPLIRAITRLRPVKRETPDHLVLEQAHETGRAAGVEVGMPLECCFSGAGGGGFGVRGGYGYGTGRSEIAWGD